MQEENEMLVYEFKMLKRFPEIFHGTFSRKGGVSLGAFSSLNLGANVADDQKHVLENMQRTAHFFGVEKVAQVRQVHGKKVVPITSFNQKEIAHFRQNFLEKKGRNKREDPFVQAEEADAMITDLKGVALLIRHADCQAALFYDPEKKRVAAAHSGWRGSCQNIYGEVLREMGSNPSKLICAISPSLGPNHAEFIHYQKELPEEFWKYQVKPNYFDFWEITKEQLLSLGLLPKNIEIARICTYTQAENYFSYRRDKTTGRNGTMIGLC